MIEISAVKVIADLFKDAIGLIQKQRENRRETFDYTFKALFDRLEPIARDYYGAVSDACAKLKDTKPDFITIYRDLEPKRASLIIARNGLIGEAEALREIYNAETLDGSDEFAKLAISFLTSILQYFEEIHLTEAMRPGLASEDLLVGAERGRISRVLPRSLLTSFMQAIRLAGEYTSETGEFVKPSELEAIRAISRTTQRALEARWTDVTKQYTSLRLHCLL